MQLIFNFFEKYIAPSEGERTPVVVDNHLLKFFKRIVFRPYTFYITFSIKVQIEILHPWITINNMNFWINLYVEDRKLLKWLTLPGFIKLGISKAMLLELIRTFLTVLENHRNWTLGTPCCHRPILRHIVIFPVEYELEDFIIHSFHIHIPPNRTILSCKLQTVLFFFALPEVMDCTRSRVAFFIVGIAFTWPNVSTNPYFLVNIWIDDFDFAQSATTIAWNSSSFYLLVVQRSWIIPHKVIILVHLTRINICSKSREFFVKFE